MPYCALSITNDDGRRVVLRGGREFLSVHQEAAVAGESYDDQLRILSLGKDRRRNAVSHRTGGRRELRGKGMKAVVTMKPAGIVTGAVADDRILRQAVE